MTCLAKLSMSELLQFTQLSACSLELYPPNPFLTQ